MKHSDLIKLKSQFDSILNVVEESNTNYWYARDLMTQLGYTEWRNFTAVINKAKTACEVSGHLIPDHFVDVNKTIQMPKNAEREVPDLMHTQSFRVRSCIYSEGVASHSPGLPRLAATLGYKTR